MVAVFILKAGWGAAKDTINPLLGASPDPELVHAIREVVLSHPQVVGMHDLIIHDYGPGRRLCSFHAEVPQDADILEAHDAIDHIEREIQQKFGIETTAHMDPIATDDESVNRLREQVAALARAVEPEMTIHDFRVTKGPQHTNLIFDVVVPHRCRLRDEGALRTPVRGGACPGRAVFCGHSGGPGLCGDPVTPLQKIHPCGEKAGIIPERTT